jgi:hypothetical protein
MRSTMYMDINTGISRVASCGTPFGTKVAHGFRIYTPVCPSTRLFPVSSVARFAVRSKLTLAEEHREAFGNLPSPPSMNTASPARSDATKRASASSKPNAKQPSKQPSNRPDSSLKPLNPRAKSTTRPKTCPPQMASEFQPESSPANWA